MSYDETPRERVFATYDPPSITGPHSRRVNLTGRRFGKLLIYGVHSRKHRALKWLGLCDCGRWAATPTAHLTKGLSRSCGCGSRVSQQTHGQSYTKEYACFRSAQQRCTNPKHRQYTEYGGRGIEFRFTSFEQFLSEIGLRPSADYSLDRINNDGHYEPGNVRWATRVEQCSNRRNTRLLIHQGRVATVSEWARLLGIPDATLRGRLRNGWSIEEALEGKR